MMEKVDAAVPHSWMVLSATALLIFVEVSYLQNFNQRLVED